MNLYFYITTKKIKKNPYLFCLLSIFRKLCSKIINMPHHLIYLITSQACQFIMLNRRIQSEILNSILNGAMET